MSDKSGALRIIVAGAVIVLAAVGARAQTAVPDRSLFGAGAQTALPNTSLFGGGAQAAVPNGELVEKRIRPLLAERCYRCHSASSQPLKGGLRLDVRSGLLKGGTRGSLFTPGAQGKSLLVRAVRYTDPTLRMPPNGRLSEEQIALLSDWVKQGAPIPSTPAPTIAPMHGGLDLKARARHWAWQPIRHPSIPQVRRKSWVRNPIDAFVLAKLEAKGLSPAGPADKRTLLRRVTYDLTGLPPSSADIHAFLADNSPNAYEKVVDRLLASPQYGERWARHWLDLVRYAETDGHEWDIEKTGAWEYRDYVIRAMNDDVPYNQFVMEHIAGDLLPDPRLNQTQHFNESVLGTGFYFLGSAAHSPVDLKDDQAERIDNQIDVLSKAFLGMGVGCARCHDHKFDAISTRDYYALYGFLKGMRLQEAPVGPPMPEQTRGALDTIRVASDREAARACAVALRGALDTAAPGANDRLAVARRGMLDTEAPGASDRLAAARRDPAAILYAFSNLCGQPQLASSEAFIAARRAVAAKMQARAEQAAKQRADTHWLSADGAREKGDGWSRTGEAFAARPTDGLAMRSAEIGGKPSIEIFGPGVRNSACLSARLAGTLRTPTFKIDRKKIFFQLSGQNAKVRLVIDGYQRIRDPIYGRLAFPVDTAGAMRPYELDVQDWIGHDAYAEFVDDGAGYIAVGSVCLADNAPPEEGPSPLLLGLVKDETITSSDALAERIRALFAQTAAMAESGAMDADAPARWDLLRWAGSVSAVTPDPTRLAAWTAERSRLETTLVDARPAPAATDGFGADEPVHLRGNYRTVGAIAQRRFLEVCDRDQPVSTTEGTGRLQLAERMLAPTNPLPARVIVNRLWLHHFGEGIVRTPDDFGIMGERPTHPELLDWLASEFVRPVQDTTAEARPASDEKRKADGGQARRPAMSGSATYDASEARRYACGWSLKRLHRLMVLSSAYRMASTGAPVADGADPQDRLLHKMPVRRLDAECVRDAILEISGRLDRMVGGAPVMPYLNAFTPGRGAPQSGPLDGGGRRSIYLSVRRNFLIPMFLAFDYPNPITTIGRRSTSNVAAQALTLLNDPFVVEQAGVWARAALAKPGTIDSRIDDLYESTFARLPRTEEREMTRAFLLDRAKSTGGIPDQHAWSDLCHVLWNVKDFIFIR